MFQVEQHILAVHEICLLISKHLCVQSYELHVAAWCHIEVSSDFIIKSLTGAANVIMDLYTHLGYVFFGLLVNI